MTVGTNVHVTWSAPVDNGSPISRYEVLWAVSDASSTFVEETVYCDGSQSSILLDRECTIPMGQFWAATSSTSLSYTQGQTLTLKIRASNAIGAGALSSVATGPVVSTVPDSPLSAPVRDEAGTSTT